MNNYIVCVIDANKYQLNVCYLNFYVLECVTFSLRHCITRDDKIIRIFLGLK